MSLRKKHVIIAASAVIIIVLIAFGTIWSVTRHTKDQAATTQPARQSKQTTTHTATLSSDNASFLETALNSPDKTERAKAVVPELRGNSWLANADLPKGSSITIDRDSFLVDKDGRGSMDGFVNGLIPVSFTLYLRQIDGTWLIESAKQT